MKRYTILYIDGHDLKFKTFQTDAENQEAAIGNLRHSYTSGDFDHRIVSIIQESKED